MRSWRSTAATTGLAALLTLSVAACSNTDSAADPVPTVTPTPSDPAPTKTGGPPEGWEDKFTPEQLQAYEAALTRWERYTDLTHEIYKEGKDTPEARKVFQKYSIRWQNDVAVLADTATRKVRVTKPEVPLWSIAQSVDLNKDGTGNLVITQCTDYSDVQIVQNGKKIKNNPPKNLVTPLTIQMTKPEGYNWMIAGIDLKDKKSCSG